MELPLLPIRELAEPITRAIQEPSARLLIKAPTGSGKSTCVPLIVDSAIHSPGLIVVVQPRRMAARLLARYVAKMNHATLGKEIGYVVRFEHNMSAHTRIVYVTDGILERWLSENPQLKGICAVIFDEFHERSLSGDLALGRILDLQESIRQDLSLLVMSATLAIADVQAYLGASCRVLDSAGRHFPVEIFYRSLQRPVHGRLQQKTPFVWEHAKLVVLEAIADPACGDILVFMPGLYEIRKTVELLEHSSGLKGWDVFALHGALSPEQQNRAVEQGKIPRIIVATNIAETSLTIEGVRTVVDSGLVRQSNWDPYRGMDTLNIKPISRASAAQRTGRAGRLAPGRCFRLWSKTEQDRKQEFDVPECLRVDLSQAVLHLAAWGITEPERFRWITPPPQHMLEHAGNLLRTLGALDNCGQLSDIGHAMHAFPLPPRLSRLLVAGAANQCFVETAAIAALLQGEGVALRTGLHDDFRDSRDFSDFQAEWRAVDKARTARFDGKICTRFGISARGVREVLQSYQQLLRIGSNGVFKECSMPDFIARQHAVIQAILCAFADRVGSRNSIAVNTCKVTGGISGRLESGSVALKTKYFVTADMAEVAAKNTETRIRRCTQIDWEDLQDLFPTECSQTNEAIYDPGLKRVRLRRCSVYRDVTLNEQDAGDAPPKQAAPVLARQVILGTLKLNKWDHTVEQWIRRLNGLSVWMPDLGLPAFGDDDRFTAITMICDGAVGYKDIRDREILPVLQQWLSPWQTKALDDYTPVSLALPNGQIAKVRYESDSSPVIALPVQRLFGVKQSPLIANGSVTVKVEVLAPNQRPWQITGSLQSFWQTGYIQMRKELAARYSKHKWPEKPHE